MVQEFGTAVYRIARTHSICRRKHYNCNRILPWSVWRQSQRQTSSQVRRVCL